MKILIMQLINIINVMKNISDISKSISKKLMLNMSNILISISNCISNISKNVSMKNTHEDSLRRVDFKFSSNMLTVAILSDSGGFLNFVFTSQILRSLSSLSSVCSSGLEIRRPDSRGGQRLGLSNRGDDQRI